MIRPAVLGDAGAMATVFVQAWHAGYRGVVPDSVINALDVGAWTARFRELVARDDFATAVLVDRPDGPAVGFTTYGEAVDHPGAGYLASLYVHPDSAGRGYGGQLLDHAIARLTATDLIEIRLWVFTGNSRARALYERKGFAPTDDRIVDPQWAAEQILYRLHTA